MACNITGETRPLLLNVHSDKELCNVDKRGPMACKITGEAKPLLVNVHRDKEIL
jgi:hypothetical protein